MKKLSLLVLMIVCSCHTRVKQRSVAEQSKISALFKKRFEHSLISRGDNFPDFNYTKDSIDFFLVALHENISIDNFRKKTGFTDIKIKEMENLLEDKNWLHSVSGKSKPSIFIATEKDGEALFRYAKPMANEIARKIKTELPEIKRQFNQTEISKTQDFTKWSFLILSDVLLDSWQIDKVEKEFLKKEQRPERHGKNYYYSIMEKTQKNRESFGIFGNQYEEVNGKSISIYGNNRSDSYEVPTKNQISKSDNQIFKQIAENFKPLLISTLNKYSKYSNKVYKNPGYKDEITFEEFFIWWYHFIYTRATEIMHDEKMLTIPKSGNFEYILEE